MNNATIIKEVESTDWEFCDCDTQYLTHNIHRYSGKFIPQIARRAIELLTNRGDVVLDSYMGSGTTLLEAQLLGRSAVGVDLNPLAVLISKVKNTTVDEKDLIEIYERLIPFVNMLSSDGQLSFIEKVVDRDCCTKELEKNEWRRNDDWNLKWYQLPVLGQLVDIYSCIETIENEKAKNIALVSFSDILRKSSNASSKYPNVMYDKNANMKALPAKTFLESLRQVISCVLELSQEVEVGHDIRIFQQSNLNLSIDDGTIDAIISHPPYIAAIPYAEYGSLSLQWFGYDIKELDSELTGGRRHSKQVVSRFSEDYQKYFFESFRVLKNKGYMFLMVGNPTAHGERIDLYEMTVNFARIAGFEHITTAIRQGSNRRGNKMGEEYVVFFQK